MKLSDFKKLIVEAIEEKKTETTMEMMEPVDDIGTFMIVKKPSGRCRTMEDILQEVSIYDSIIKEEIIMATTNKSAARKRAKEALKEYEVAKEALKKEMEEEIIRNPRSAPRSIPYVPNGTSFNSTPNIYGLTDPVLGGLTGAANAPIRNALDNCQYLYNNLSNTNSL